MDHPSSTPTPTLAQATRVWGRIGLLSFGGPAAQIALMHQEIVEKRAWLSEAQFLNALSFCMLLPGPEAMQLATYTGWRLHGTWGGIIAGLLFVLPGACVIMALATIYSLYGSVPLVEALFVGVKAAVLVIVVQALLRLAKTALGQRFHWMVAGGAFVALFFLSVPYPLVVLVAGLVGWFLSDATQPHVSPRHQPVPISCTLRDTGIWLGIWVLPFAVLFSAGADPLLREVGAFFSKLAVVTFGGAYAVLAYMAQDVVKQFGWLSAPEMVDALGLAETTPGPLILVTQFVGFLAGYNSGGFSLGLLAALVTLWVTFVPCFLWIFVGAPYIAALSDLPRLRGALQAITAAVVGVILNLSIWFALHVLFNDVDQIEFGPITLWVPEVATVQWIAFALFGLCGWLSFSLGWGILRILGLAAGVSGALAAVI